MAARCDDPYKDVEGVATPASHWYTVTPSDSEYLAIRPKYLLIGGTGSTQVFVAIEDPKGGIAVIPCVPGSRIDCRPVRIRATGTTAGTIYACY
jgi:hypothetical protein